MCYRNTAKLDFCLRFKIVSYTPVSVAEVSKKKKEACFSGVIRRGAPFCRHCFVSLSNPWSIIKGLTDITAFAASSHLAKWPGNNTQMKWQAIKSKYRSCKEKQNAPWGQGYSFVFSVFNLSLMKMWPNRFSGPQKERGPFGNTCQLNSIILSSEENKQTKKHPAHFPDLGPYYEVCGDFLRNYFLS